ncbi:ECF subfamily RNA polymerase sigma-24 subunit [Streptomyces malaysiensis]|uniref:ECF subfamily RNA polymerase sigma-24 subunit n=1 Tax=Streptomyces malaysiensis TaxID=92644 RepID=A0A7X6AX44_STRMQ|nr:ECF subfamily RNA polymerase sigma-24 subunit [Streptomyces malaysiensis]
MSAPTDDAAAASTARAVPMDTTHTTDPPRAAAPEAPDAPEGPDGLSADAQPDLPAGSPATGHPDPPAAPHADLRTAAPHLDPPGPPDPQAEFRDFFERHHAELARLAHLLLGSSDGADDLAADALVAVWHQWDRVRAADHPAAYARGVVANLARSRIRSLVRERRRVALFSSQRSDHVDDPDVSAVVDVQAALVRLPFRKRACVVLRHAFDLSERETARTLGISVGTVKSQTSRGIAELERLLGPPDDEGELLGATDAGRTVRTLRSGNTGPTGTGPTGTGPAGPARHSGRMGHAGHAGGGS